jgi:hypothetical protein
MRTSRRPIASALLLGAALVMATPALSASPPSSWGQGPLVPPGWDATLRLVGRVVGWFGGAWVEEGATPYPNDTPRLAPPRRGGLAAAGRPTPGARPNGGATPDPNGNPPPAAAVRP